MILQKELKQSSLTVRWNGKIESQAAGHSVYSLNSSYCINQNVRILKTVNYMLSSLRCAIIKTFCIGSLEQYPRPRIEKMHTYVRIKRHHVLDILSTHCKKLLKLFKKTVKLALQNIFR